MERSLQLSGGEWTVKRQEWKQKGSKAIAGPRRELWEVCTRQRRRWREGGRFEVSRKGNIIRIVYGGGWVSKVKCRMGLVLRRGTRRGSSGPVWMCWFEMTMRCMCEDDRLRNAEEGLVGGRKQSGCSVQRRCGHRRDHPGDSQPERLGLILGLDKLRSGPVKDTESHGKTRRGCCLKGKGTEV